MLNDKASQEFYELMEKYDRQERQLLESNKDIIEKLRAAHAWLAPCPSGNNLLCVRCEAAVEIERLRTIMEYDAAALDWILNYVIDEHSEILRVTINPDGIKRYISDIRKGKRDHDGCRIWTPGDKELIEEMSKRATRIDVSRFDPWVASEFPPEVAEEVVQYITLTPEFRFPEESLEQPEPAPIGLGSSQRAELESEIERLRAQVAELLPWAYKALGPRSFANALGDEGEELLSRIDSGEFGEVES